jgi:hypothetical protein
MSDPCLHARFDIAALDLAVTPAVAQSTQPVAEAPDIVFGQAPPPIRQENSAQEFRRIACRRDERLARMQTEAATRRKGVRI